MPKKKKTREQKVLAEMHRREQPAHQERYSYSVTAANPQADRKPSVKTAPVQTSEASHYSYLSHDLRKTLIVTAIIVALQIALFYFL